MELLYILIVLSVIIIILLLLVIFKNKSNPKNNIDYSHLIQEEIDKSMQKYQAFIKTIFDQNAENQQIKNQALFNSIGKVLDDINKTLISDKDTLEKSLSALTDKTSLAIRTLQEDNAKKLDEMRGIVDEKMQKTLEDRINKSIEAVVHQLENVSRAIGEVKTLANDVGSLQRVLTNVKTKGILGEIQLGAILQEILTKDQYEENIATKKGSADRVEFAIKLPGSKDEPVYLPIDSKFPLEPYNRLLDAYDTCDKASIQEEQRSLKTALTNNAKTIASKYLDVPHTTDFAIMFLPLEGLYAEAIKLGLVEELQNKYRINIAGPSTMSALLNSLQMGFKTLLIQKRSADVWKTLKAVKAEFLTFESVLNDTKNKIEKVQDNLEKLVGVRTRQINSKLRGIETPSEYIDQVDSSTDSSD